MQTVSESQVKYHYDFLKGLQKKVAEELKLLAGEATRRITEAVVKEYPDGVCPRTRQLVQLARSVQTKSETVRKSHFDFLTCLLENVNAEMKLLTDEANRRATEAVKEAHPDGVCSITCQLMKDPVTLEDGSTYEKSAIERWFQTRREKRNSLISPLTREAVNGKFAENRALKNILETLLKEKTERILGEGN